MSDYARDGVWNTKGLTPMQRCILLAIAEECESGCESKPVTQEALGGMCECSWLWILRETQKLEQRGILEIMRPSAGEGHKASIYRIIHPDVRAEAEEHLPDGLAPEPEKEKVEDPLWLKKKRSGSRNSGELTRARKIASVVNASGQPLIATGSLTISLKM